MATGITIQGFKKKMQYSMRKHRALQKRRALELAQLGDTTAKLKLALLLLQNEKGLEATDSKQAVKWLREAASQHNAEAELQLAWCLFYGVGCEIDRTEARLWCQQAASRSSSLPAVAAAQFYLGKWLLQGSCGFQDITQGWRWIEMAAKRSHAEALYELARKITSSKLTPTERDYKQAFEWLKKSAEAGHLPAQLRLAVYLRNGSGCSVDLESAFRWDLKAATGGHAEAMYRLGCCYESGQGCPVNDSKALHWFCKAARNNHPGAQFEVGLRYLQPFPQCDTKQAVSWLELAANQGHVAAQLKLAHCFSQGLGCDRNAERAFYWNLQAAEQGNCEGQYWVGAARESGEGCSVNLEQAFDWYSKAASQGHVSAQFSLGMAYVRGAGCPADNAKAFECFQRAADQGDKEAMSVLGGFLEHGKGCSVNLEAAFQMYLKAAEGGVWSAQRALANWYATGKNNTEPTLSRAMFWYVRSLVQEVTSSSSPDDTALLLESWNLLSVLTEKRLKNAHCQQCLSTHPQIVVGDCGHVILCQNCIKKKTSPKCLQCGAPAVFYIYKLAQE